MSTIASNYMNLPVPVVGQEPGPQWATDINNCLTIIDQHNHSSGSGVQITPAGLNINSDFTLNNNNLTAGRSFRLSEQTAVLGLGSDLNCLYDVSGDLYFNDGIGNVIRITQSGGVAGSPGSISNLTSPASASYVSANQTFVWQSAANTPANMDGGSFILRNISASSKGVTLSAPNSLAADYALTLPSLPSGQKLMTLDASGNMSAPWAFDNSTIEVASNTVQVKDGGITTAKLANGSVTTAKLGPANIQTGSGSGIFNSSSVAFTPACSVTITSTGRPLLITAGADPASALSLNAAMLIVYNTSGGGSNVTGYFRLVRGTTEIARTQQTFTSNTGANQSFGVPPACILAIDNPAAGTYTYTLEITYINSNAVVYSAVGVQNIVLTAVEL